MGIEVKPMTHVAFYLYCVKYSTNCNHFRKKIQYNYGNKSRKYDRTKACIVLLSGYEMYVSL